jgi:superfamily II DNA/RNA helicase
MIGCVLGGVPLGTQRRMLSQRIDLLVATPGRLIDHLERQSVKLDQVELLVLDEADRMLDMGFIHAVKRIVKACTARPRQTLMFTATWDDRMAKLATEMLTDPVRIKVAHSQITEAAIEQRVHLADDGNHKDRLLQHLLTHGEPTQTLVFAGTKRRVKKLADQLERQGHKAGELHGDMKQSARNRTLDALKRNQLRVLVATDVAGRGIDVSGLGLVINYDLPNVPEDYTHRIGRTGRAGASGVAVSLVSLDDRPLLAAIEKATGKSIERVEIPGLEPVVVYHPSAGRQAKGPARRPQRRGGRPQGSGGQPSGGRPSAGQQFSGRGGDGEHRPAFLTRKTGGR